tara:strand:+ start:901 stop:2679 length:1779 start_codon:yes stop_codon:yes gene_type:complete
MPQKKGAPVRAPKFKSSAPKSGSKSPKHRGYRAEDAAAGTASAPKKARWSSDDRVARGRNAERPRGGESAARGERTGERPNWEPRPKQSRFERDAQRTGRVDRDARPARGDRDERPRYNRDDRPARGDRDERPRYNRDERPAREDRPRREFGNDRPRRDFRDDRPARAPRQDEAARFVPTDDVVLERLEAQAIVAGDSEGVSFGDLGLGDNIVRALAELGAASPFPIQAGTIPEVLAGRDVLGRGRTGSGKTIAFGAPLVERLLRMQAGDSKRRQPGRKPRALILAPTRELALQIDRTVQPIARSVGLFTTQIYGGVPYARQLGALDRGVDIVIGTPGRIQDLSAQGRLDLSQVVVTVLDEADHMCELGFAEPVQDILDRTSEGGQKLLFSATLDKGVAEIVERYLVEPSVHEVAGEDQASSTIDHRVLVMDQRDKLAVLAELASGPGKKLVFARTRAFAEQLADFLDEADIAADAIHGDLNQSRRQRALEKFSRGRLQALVATDVAARGIHVDDVDLVIQADAPDEYKSYLHRSGRTGRAGKSGVVVTLVPRNRRRKVEDLLSRAEITAEWIQVRPGDDVIRDLAEGVAIS